MRELILTKTGSVRHLAFSPDGSRLVATASNCNVRVCEVAGPRRPAVLRNTADALTTAFTADGTAVVAFFGFRRPVLTHLRSGEQRQPLETQTRTSTGGVLTADAERFVSIEFVGDRWRVSCRRLADGELVWRSMEGGRRPLLLAPAGRILVVEQLGTMGVCPVLVLDAADGHVLGEFRTSRTAISAAAVSPCSRWLATAGHNVAVHDLADAGQAIVIDPLGATAVVWSPDGSRLAVGRHGEVAFRRTGAWVSEPSLPATGLVGSLAYSSDGSLLAVGIAGRVVLWDAV